MVNIIIPMAGNGSRFKQAGYSVPKPLIDVNGKPMIQRVVENINLPGKYIFLVLKEHYDQYCLKYLLPLICKNPCEIVIVDRVTEGAACTILLASNFLDDNELIIANSDQLVEWDSSHFLYYMRNNNADGGIVTFFGNDPKWSFAKINESGLITEVAEKNPISNAATAGIYYFKSGHKFHNSANQMISKNIRTNNEFYVAPVFNEIIEEKILNYPIPKMHGLGTPNDLEYYLRNI